MGRSAEGTAWPAVDGGDLDDQCGQGKAHAIRRVRVIGVPLDDVVTVSGAMLGSGRAGLRLAGTFPIMP